MYGKNIQTLFKVLDHELSVIDKETEEMNAIQFGYGQRGWFQNDGEDARDFRLHHEGGDVKEFSYFPWAKSGNPKPIGR